MANMIEPTTFVAHIRERPRVFAGVACAVVLASILLVSQFTHSTPAADVAAPAPPAAAGATPAPTGTPVAGQPTTPAGQAPVAPSPAVGGGGGDGGSSSSGDGGGAALATSQPNLEAEMNVGVPLAKPTARRPTPVTASDVVSVGAELERTATAVSSCAATAKDKWTCHRLVPKDQKVEHIFTSAPAGLEISKATSDGQLVRLAFRGTVRCRMLGTKPACDAWAGPGR